MREKFYLLCKNGIIRDVHYFTPTDYGGTDTGMIPSGSELGNDRSMTGLIRHENGKFTAAKATVFGELARRSPKIEEFRTTFTPAGLTTIREDEQKGEPKTVFNELYHLYGLKWILDNDSMNIKSDMLKFKNFLSGTSFKQSVEHVIMHWLTLENQYLLYTEYITLPQVDKRNQNGEILEFWMNSENGMKWRELMREKLPKNKFSNYLKIDDGKQFEKDNRQFLSYKLSHPREFSRSH